MTERHHRPPQAGPPLPVPAGVALVLTVASLVLFASGPRPDSSAQDALAYVQAHDTRLHVLAFVVFAVAIPLAVWTAAAYRRLRRLGVTAPGAAIALVGGTLAAAATAASGLVMWVAAATADDLTAPLARVLLQLSFAAGGVGYAVPLGLLIAGVSVPILVLRLAPRALGWIGIVLAVVAAGATFGLVTDALFPLLPVVRFGGLVWLVAAGILLPLTRRRAAAEQSDAEAVS